MDVSEAKQRSSWCRVWCFRPSRGAARPDILHRYLWPQGEYTTCTATRGTARGSRGMGAAPRCAGATQRASDAARTRRGAFSVSRVRAARGVLQGHFAGGAYQHEPAKYFMLARGRLRHGRSRICSCPLKSTVKMVRFVPSGAATSIFGVMCSTRSCMLCMF